MKRTLLNFIAISVFGFAANAEDLTIPAPNFKAYLVGNAAINTNMDTEIKITDLIGRETTFKPNTPLIYIYSDGTAEKVFKLEEL